MGHIFGFQNVTHASLLPLLTTLYFWFQGFLPSSAIQPAKPGKMYIPFYSYQRYGMYTMNSYYLNKFGYINCIHFPFYHHFFFKKKHAKLFYFLFTHSLAPYHYPSLGMKIIPLAQISCTLVLHIPYALILSIVHKESIQISTPPLVN